MPSALSLSTRGPATGARAVVLVLPGGQAVSTAPARRGLAWARSGRLRAELIGPGGRYREGTQQPPRVVD